MADQRPPHSFQCRMLNDQLRVVETIPLNCRSEKEAIEQSVEMLRRRRDGPLLSGFELRRGDERVLVRLENVSSEQTHDLIGGIEGAPVGE